MGNNRKDRPTERESNGRHKKTAYRTMFLGKTCFVQSL
jgi:hypothetical protein